MRLATASSTLLLARSSSLIGAFAPTTTTRFAATTTTASRSFSTAAWSDLNGDAAVAETPSSSKDPNVVSRRAGSVASFKVMDVLQRANELQAEGREIHHCEVGQPESGAPAAVAEAAREALTGPPRQVMGYTDAFGLPALRARIADHYRAAYENVADDRIDPRRIVVTTGSSGGFLLTFTTCFDVGDVVAVASSGYPCYRNILSALGCELTSVPINDEFKITATELRNELDRRRAAGEKPIRGLILSSPSNPTGAMLRPDELKELCELCDAEGVQFISDEIYHGISYGSVKEATALQYSDKVIVINSFSKYYSMSGWRLGWMVVPPALVDPVNSLQQNMFISAPGVSQTAALRCWDDDTIEELEGHVEKYRASRSVLLDELSTIFDDHQIAPADGGFYVYVDVGEDAVCLSEGLGTVELCRTFLEEEGVAITPGVDFEDPAGDLGEKRLRVSYAGGIETARECSKRFKRFWPRWMERVKAAKGE